MTGRNAGRLDRVQRLVAPEVCPSCQARAGQPIDAAGVHALLSHALVETVAGRMDRRTGAAAASLGRAVIESLVVVDFSEEIARLSKQLADLQLTVKEESHGPERA